MIHTRFLYRCLLMACLAVFSPSVCQSPAQETWRVGAARVNITPDQPLWMAGYASRTHEALGKYCDLWIRTCALEDSARAAWRSCHWIWRAWIAHYRKPSVNLWSNAADCAGARWRCVLPTHTPGPWWGEEFEPLHYRQLNDEQRKRIDQYSEVLQQRVVDCVRQAINDLRPCEVCWGLHGCVRHQSARESGGQSA